VEDGEGWMNMIKSRNQSLHTYNEGKAKELVNNIIQSYFDLFAAFKIKMIALIDK
jgi:hypothetical protein